MTGIKTFLSELGKDAKAVFGWLSSSAGQAEVAEAEGGAVAVASAVNPAAGAALAGVGALFNAGLQEVVKVEQLAASAGTQTGSGVQKAAAVEQAVTPQISVLLQTLGVKSPTATQIQSVAKALSTGVAGVLNALPPAPAASA